MTLFKIEQAFRLNVPATEQQIAMLKCNAPIQIPLDYEFFLKNHNGLLLDCGISLYSTEDVLERNETFDVFNCLSDYLSIGDDSGGILFVIKLSTNEVYSVSQGDMDIDEVEYVAHTLTCWINDNFKYDQ